MVILILKITGSEYAIYCLYFSDSQYPLKQQLFQEGFYSPLFLGDFRGD